MGWSNTCFNKNDLDGALGDNTAGTGGSGTSVTLTSTSGFSSSGHILVGSELITYTGISSNDLTGITRGVLGSTRADTVTQRW